MPEYQETPNDLIRKYTDTYRLHKDEIIFNGDFHYSGDEPEAPEEEGDDEEPVRTRRENDTIKVRLFSHHTKAWNIVDYSEKDFQDILVTKKYFNMFPYIMFPCFKISRSPFRQWRRSICQDTITLFNPVSYFKDVTIPIPIKTTLDGNIVNMIINPTYPQFSEWNDLLSVYGSIAITPDFGLCLSPNISHDILLFSFYGIIGTLQNKHDVIYVHHKPSFQEVSDLVKRNNFPLVVKDA